MKIRLKAAFLLIILLGALRLSAQDEISFGVSVVPLGHRLPKGFQSFAVAQQGDWLLLVGGRKDGLHRRQPFASFDVAGINAEAIAFNLKTGVSFVRSLKTLNPLHYEILSASNTQFLQDGNNLLLTGGYRYSSIIKDHTTYPYLLVIDVQKLFEWTCNKTDDVFVVDEVRDENLQLTGGRLAKMHNVYYLAGGHKFLGAYNPRGPEHGPGFLQEYSAAARLFRWNGVGTYSYMKSIVDSQFLRKRDFNIANYYLNDTAYGIMVFSGVFQKDLDIPVLNIARIEQNGNLHKTQMHQYLANYHCPVLAFANAATKDNYFVFLGGIAQHYLEGNTLVSDPDVPFTKNISVIKASTNRGGEYLLKDTMPFLLGSAAEFVPVNGFMKINDVVMLDSIPTDSLLMGYIVGGIKSSAPNIFWDNEGDLSNASNYIYKVFIHKPNAPAVKSRQSTSGLSLQAFTIGESNLFYVLQDSIYVLEGVKFLDESSNEITDAKLVKKGKTQGKVFWKYEIPNLSKHKFLTIKVQTYDDFSQKVIIK